MTVTAHDVEAALRAAFDNPSQLVVTDDSAAHAGHAGAAQGSHFSVSLVSTRFTGLTRLARHRLVYDAVRSLMAERLPQGIHALAVQARAPDES